MSYIGARSNVYIIWYICISTKSVDSEVPIYNIQKKNLKSLLPTANVYIVCAQRISSSSGIYFYMKHCVQKYLCVRRDHSENVWINKRVRIFTCITYILSWTYLYISSVHKYIKYLYRARLICRLSIWSKRYIKSKSVFITT